MPYTASQVPDILVVQKFIASVVRDIISATEVHAGTVNHHGKKLHDMAKNIARITGELSKPQLPDTEYQYRNELAGFRLKMTDQRDAFTADLQRLNMATDPLLAKLGDWVAQTTGNEEQAA